MVLFFILLFAICNYFILVIFLSSQLGQWKIIWFIAAIWSIFNIIFNYVMAIRVEPGTPTDIPSYLLSEIHHKCRTCGVIKPPRTHHCSICNKCVIQMDRIYLIIKITALGQAPVQVIIIANIFSIFQRIPVLVQLKCCPF